ncbi:MAG: hypothetical protein BWX48_03166 [Verrucomicrobia bacterium ADurb.Bin006]|nr:MAG: hypothetical protein BWX48_03166 [Verrucomicrobia bacterium ADurb.Bin006]
MFFRHLLTVGILTPNSSAKVFYVRQILSF